MGNHAGTVSSKGYWLIYEQLAGSPYSSKKDPMHGIKVRDSASIVYSDYKYLTRLF